MTLTLNIVNKSINQIKIVVVKWCGCAALWHKQSPKKRPLLPLLLLLVVFVHLQSSEETGKRLNKATKLAELMCWPTLVSASKKWTRLYCYSALLCFYVMKKNFCSDKRGMALPDLKDYYCAAQIRILGYLCDSQCRARWKETEGGSAGPPIQALTADPKLQESISDKNNPWIKTTRQTESKVVRNTI